jgi:hypothetical protein
VRVRPISPSSLIAELATRIVSAAASAGAPRRWLRVAIDGAPAARPDRLADALVDPLRVAGHPALRIRAEEFHRPASLRLEFGRTNPDAYYEGWLDEAGLSREVLDPVKPGGTGRVLPSLWNAETDRASRAAYVTLPPGGVVLVSGNFLLGGVLSFDLTVHLAMSAAALGRRTAAEDRWTLPAFSRYAAEVAPETFADLVVRYDDPRHPAVVEAGQW